MKLSDLQVYGKLCILNQKVYDCSLLFPKFEMYELGSQVRRSANSAPANIAEGFGNKHTNIYLETISRAQGEIRETIHHLQTAAERKYLSKENVEKFKKDYEECSKMLYGLEQGLKRNSGS